MHLGFGAALAISLWALVPSTACALQSNMEVVYRWRTPDWTWRSSEQRQQAMESGSYNPDHVLPISMEVAGDRVFLSYSNLRKGTPATLATVPRERGSDDSPLQTPYPSWDWHYDPASGASRLDCDHTLVFTQRTKADSCGRLWVLDSGQYAYFENHAVLCPAKLVVFDLDTNQPVRNYLLPKDQYSAGSSFVSVSVDTSTGCEDAYAYWADTTGQSVTVYSWRTSSSWVFRGSVFAPSPANSSASKLFIQGVEFSLSDGVYQVVLPSQRVPPMTGEGSVFWHALNSYAENTVPASVLRDPRAAEQENNPAFRKIGERGEDLGLEVLGAVDSRGIMFYLLGNRDAVACWNTRHPYRSDTQAVLTQATPGALYPSGLSVVPSQDDPREEEVWLLSTGQVRAAYAFYYSNFTFAADEDRLVLYRARARDLSRGSVCERETPPSVSSGGSGAHAGCWSGTVWLLLRMLLRNMKYWAD